MTTTTTTTETTFPADAREVNQSTAECAAHNAGQAEAIALGLVEAWKPSAARLAQEAKEAAEAAVRLKRFAAKVGILKAIWDALPEAVRACYLDPTTPEGQPPKSWTGDAFLKTTNPRWDSVTLEAYRRSVGSWKNEFAYYRVVVGGYGDKSILKLNKDLSATRDQLAKVAAKVAEHHARRLCKNEAQNAKVRAEKRYRDFVGKPEGKALVGRIAGTTYVSDYGTSGFAVCPDGRLTYNGETFAAEQWAAVCDLRDKHAAELKALKASFSGKAVAA